MVSVATLNESLFKHMIPDSYRADQHEKSEFWSELPILLSQIASRVRENWDSFSPSEKEALIDFYHIAIGEGKISTIDKVKGIFHILKLRVSYGSNYISTLNDALNNLKYALTDLIENRNPQYSRDISKALKNIDKGEREVSPDTLDEWFREMAD